MAEPPAPLPPRWTQQAWMARGSCRGRTAVFFASHAERPQARARAYAREHREFGIWGGESEEDRAGHGYSVPWPLRDRRRSFETPPVETGRYRTGPSALA
jgi:hypothetical protein